MKKTLLFIFLITLTFAGKSQFAVNYYYDGNTIGRIQSNDRCFERNGNNKHVVGRLQVHF